MLRNPKFAIFVRNINTHPEARGLMLQAFLVTPVQRIPRYKMLLEDMYKHTPSDHPDYHSLNRALSLISDIASFVNETIRDHETMLKTVEIQKSMTGLKIDLLSPGRRFIKRGKVLKVSRRAMQPRELYLFSDVLICASSNLNLNMSDSYRVHRVIFLDALNIVDVPDGEARNVFQVVNRDKSFDIIVDSVFEKKEWLEAFRTAKLDVGGSLRRGLESVYCRDSHWITCGSF